MKSKKQLVREGMIAYLQNAEQDYKSKHCSEYNSGRKIKVKAKDIWDFINDRYPQVTETKYRPSTLKSVWTRINPKFNNKFEMVYDIKQGPLPKGKSKKSPLLISESLITEPISPQLPTETTLLIHGLDTKASTEVSESEAKADVDHDPLWSNLTALEPNISEDYIFSTTVDNLAIIESFDKFLEDINSSIESTQLNYSDMVPPKAISEVSDSPQFNQTIDDIFAFIMDQELY